MAGKVACGLPIANLALSPFCKELTSISQADVDKAAPLSKVLKEVSEKVSKLTSTSLKSRIFISWGEYDRKQFERDCARHEIGYPFKTHFNLKQAFLSKYKMKRGGVRKALEVLGLNFEGTPHRGADDAYNIARIFMQDFGPTGLIASMKS